MIIDFKLVKYFKGLKVVKYHLLLCKVIIHVLKCIQLYGRYTFYRVSYQGEIIWITFLIRDFKEVTLPKTALNMSR